MKLLDGREASEHILQQIKKDVDKLKAEGHKAPHLAAILVGDDGASQTYVNNKIKNCEKVGFESTCIRLPAFTEEDELLNTISDINNNSDIDGLIVQLPLPRHIDPNKVIMAIRPAKDVDGFHPQNVGRMMLNLPTYIPATPRGILELLKYYDIDTAGKHCVVLGRSHIVGLPMSVLMARNGNPGNCTVTLCHSRTSNLKAICQEADILIAAIGKPEYVTADMVKQGAVVVDVGITRVADDTHPKGYRLKGDVAFDDVAPKCSYITPVPGGVGLMTIASLLTNTLAAARNEVY